MIRQAIRRLLAPGRQEHISPHEKAHYQPGKAFDVPIYDDINQSRLRHLRWLALPVRGKRVIELGAGIGRLTSYFEDQQCDVLCVDGRAENIAKLRELYPHRRAEVVDLETDQVLRFGKFDIVFCYGLLYHLVDVFGMVRRAAGLCQEMIVIETVVAPFEENFCCLVRENPKDVTQALHGLGSRPSPAYVRTCLQMAGFKFIYAPTEAPDHQQFHYKTVRCFEKWKRDRHVRNIFVASYKQLDCERLTLLDQP